jgi:hypothetical protein
MDDIIKNIESQKSGEKFHDFVLDDAVYYIKKAQDALAEGLANPEEWYNNEKVNTMTFYSLFPQIYLTQQRLRSVRNESVSQDASHPISNP